ncbi:hypothetical protein CWB41_11460 [Methylovirgula ligni]|uniref:Uncharacterized protein n=1 Tax=Methylovirgula ligni TaxID=569860 RepID=A0A3D9YWT3_9HYPH|nr:hypothetical protein [Methylovirgula ligni]QAY96270.1 hypothetical protein CWB41_11460 [Methylovirgula ligni]REF86023.1 hypothetical protein DES32_2065 [Methylovirgula ligni]
MPTPSSPLTSEKSLAIVGSAVLFALLDKLAAKGVLERSEIQDVLKTAKGCVNARSNSFCGPEAIELMKSLCQRFGKVPEEC